MQLISTKTRLVVAALVLAVGAAAGSAYAEEIEYFRTDTPEFMASAKQGKQLFEAYQCALCHATREGQALTKDIIAPNLILAKDRLRPEWMLEWIIDPQKLQPGTKMPNFFSFNTDDDENNIYTDADAHTQFKMITALRDYLMVLGTDKEAQLDKVNDAGMPIAGVQRSAAPAAAPAPEATAAEPSENGAGPEAAVPGNGATDADAAAEPAPAQAH